MFSPRKEGIFQSLDTTALHTNLKVKHTVTPVSQKMSISRNMKVVSP